LIVGTAVVVIGVVAAIIALLVPAIPFVLLGFVIWAIVKANRPQPTAG
jgi:cytosine/uracil/thiamine/allantoin permease